MLIAVFVIVLLIPLSVASMRHLRYEQWIGATDDAAARVGERHATGTSRA